MIPHVDVDWTQVFIALLALNAVIVALLSLTGVLSTRPHQGRHTARAIEEHADDTRPYRVTPRRELDRAGVA